MNIKSLLLGSAAALVAVSGARAADAVVVAEPEPVEYVRVCDVYGAGFYYIPGTETCLKVSGYARYDIGAGDNGFFGVTSVDKKDAFDDIINGRTDRNDTQSAWDKKARFALRVDARSETELGTLRAYMEARFNWQTSSVAESLNPNSDIFDGTNGKVSTQGFSSTIADAYIELGGFRAGKTDSMFSTFTNYAGGVIHDDIIPYGPFDTNQLSYTFNAGNGFTAAVALENGGGDDQYYDSGAFNVLDSYVPDVVGGVGYTGGWGGVSAVAAYDAVWEQWAAKARLDVKASDAVSLFIMGGYKSADDLFNPKTGELVQNLQSPNFYGGWGGQWALWGGATWQVNPKAAINAQLCYDDFENFAAVANVAYELVPGFKITPEVAYIDNFSDNCQRGNFAKVCSDDKTSNSGSFGGFLRLQRNF